MPPTTPLRAYDPPALGPYRLLGRLGRGGQGVVYLGTDDGGTRAAVKALHERSEDPRQHDRFAREVAAARRVEAFCTAQVLAADLDHDPPWVASEYVDGPTLQAAVRDQGPRSGAALVRLAVATATALTAIHNAGVVHRDFKPGNVILGPDGARVIDFGVARQTDSTVTGGVVGTPAYMAPEQIRGEPAGPAADVFAWGCVVTYAATGTPPFGADEVAAVVHRVLDGEPRLGDLAEPLRSLVGQCLRKDQAARPAAEEVLLRLLARTGTGAPAGPTDSADPAPGLATVAEPETLTVAEPETLTAPEPTREPGPGGRVPSGAAYPGPAPPPAPLAPPARSSRRRRGPLLAAGAAVVAAALVTTTLVAARSGFGGASPEPSGTALVTASGTVDPEQVPATFAGVWTGTVDRAADERTVRTVTVRLVTGQVAVTVTYPDAGCGIRPDVVFASSATLILRHDEFGCVTNRNIRIDRRQDGRLRYAESGASYQDTFDEVGVLHRR